MKLSNKPQKNCNATHSEQNRVHNFFVKMQEEISNINQNRLQIFSKKSLSLYDIANVKKVPQTLDKWITPKIRISFQDVLRIDLFLLRHCFLRFSAQPAACTLVVCSASLAAFHSKEKVTNKEQKQKPWRKIIEILLNLSF